MRRIRLLIAMLCAAALVSGLNESLALLVASNTAPAAAAGAAQGTGGQFVAAQGRILDTRPATQVGPYNSKMAAGGWRSLQVAGMTMSDGSQLPDAVSAVAVNFTVISPAGAGYLNADKDDDSPYASIAYMRYTSTDDQSNTGTLAVGTNGKIQVRTSNVTDLLIDVEGYYTADDTVAPGGYVPVTPKRIIDTYNGIGRPAGKLSGGSTTTIPVAGTNSGVPANASAAIVNITTSSDTATSNHSYVPYPADEPRPSKVSMSVPIGDTDASQVQVGLSNTGSPLGAFNLYLSPGSYSIHVQVDVVGYFAPGTSGGAFTPGATRVYATGTYDTNTPKRSAIAPQATTRVQIAGVNGVPAVGSGISAASVHLSVYAHGTNGGYVAMWASGKPRPSPYSSVNLARNGNFIGNMVTTELGSDGAVSIFNQSQDAIDVLVDIEGWYTYAGTAVPDGSTETEQYLKLKASTAGSGAWVSYRYRATETGDYLDVPVADIADAGGSYPAQWPVAKVGSDFAQYTWDVGATLTTQGQAEPGTLVEVVACYGASSTDSSLACGRPIDITYVGLKPDTGPDNPATPPTTAPDEDPDPAPEQATPSRTISGTLRNVDGTPQPRVLVTVSDGDQEAPDSVDDAHPFAADVLGTTVTDSSGAWSFTLPDTLEATQQQEVNASGGVLNVDVDVVGKDANNEQTLLASASTPVGVGTNTGASSSSSQSASTASVASSSGDAGAINDAVAAQTSVALTLHASSEDGVSVVSDPMVEQPGELAANATVKPDSQPAGGTTTSSTGSPVVDSGLSDADATKGNAPAAAGYSGNPDVVGGTDYRGVSLAPLPQGNVRVAGGCYKQGVVQKKYETRYTVVGEAHQYWDAKSSFRFFDRFANTTSTRVSYNGRYWGVSGGYSFTKEFGEELTKIGPRTGKHWGHQIVIPIKYKWTKEKTMCQTSRGVRYTYKYQIKPHSWNPDAHHYAIATGNDVSSHDGLVGWSKAKPEYRARFQDHSGYSLYRGHSQKFEVAVKAFGLGISVETSYSKESSTQHRQIIEFGAGTKYSHDLFNYRCRFGSKKCEKKVFYSY